MINEVRKFKTKPSVKITLHTGNSYVRTLIELMPTYVIIIGTDRQKYNISKELIESICKV
jgi:hypothetical protein